MLSFFGMQSLLNSCENEDQKIKHPGKSDRTPHVIWIGDLIQFVKMKAPGKSWEDVIDNRTISSKSQFFYNAKWWFSAWFSALQEHTGLFVVSWGPSLVLTRVTLPIACPGAQMFQAFEPKMPGEQLGWRWQEKGLRGLTLLFLLWIWTGSYKQNLCFP